MLGKTPGTGSTISFTCEKDQGVGGGEEDSPGRPQGRLDRRAPRVGLQPGQHGDGQGCGGRDGDNNVIAYMCGDVSLAGEGDGGGSQPRSAGRPTASRLA